MHYLDGQITIRLNVLGTMRILKSDRLKSRPMRIVSSATANPDTRDAIRFLLAGIVADGGRPPDFLSVHYSSNHDAGVLQEAVADFGQVRAFLGASSCRGIMTDTSLLIDEPGGIGIFALWDEGGDFGSASGDISDDPASDARQLALSALRRAGRAGEMPDLVWLSAAPGHEEEILAGIRDVVGEGALIVGGSSADTLIAGDWTQFGPDGVCRQGLAVSVLFSTGLVTNAFHSGYVESGRKGRVTRVSGRRLHEIDGLPAADVYMRWTGLDLPRPEGARPLPILAETTFNPLGRVSGMIASSPFHMLIHPAAVWPDGSLDLFASVAEGDEIHCMTGSTQSLITRAGRLTESVTASLASNNSALSGALIVYCGGCMLGLLDRMEEVRKGVSDQMGGRPFLGVFSFGEQGRVRSGSVQHGNLMISCTAFGNG